MDIKAKIIIVDDSEFSRRTIASILTEAGYDIVGEASTAEEAIALSQTHFCDLYIIDVVMPDLSGIDLAEFLRNKVEDAKFIMISSLNMDSVVVDAIRAGALDFITKPFEKQELLDSIEKVLSRSSF